MDAALYKRFQEKLMLDHNKVSELTRELNAGKVDRADVKAALVECKKNMVVLRAARNKLESQNSGRSEQGGIVAAVKEAMKGLIVDEAEVENDEIDDVPAGVVNKVDKTLSTDPLEFIYEMGKIEEAKDDAIPFPSDVKNVLFRWGFRNTEATRELLLDFTVKEIAESQEVLQLDKEKKLFTKAAQLALIRIFTQKNFTRGKNLVDAQGGLVGTLDKKMFIGPEVAKFPFRLKLLLNAVISEKISKGYPTPPKWDHINNYSI